MKGKTTNKQPHSRLEGLHIIGHPKPKGDLDPRKREMDGMNGGTPVRGPVTRVR